jgi:protocatechuate 4,5-dioxygenase, beta chain
MARILGGIGASHAPSMEHVYDRGETGSDEWRPLFGPFDEVREWLEGIRPDVLFVIYNDHFDHFWLDAWPQFALGVAEEFPIADEGQGPRQFPPIRGDADLAWHILRSLVADEFDITVCQEMEVDHGVISPLPMIDFSTGRGWQIPVIPFVSNVILHPLPLPRRFWNLGKALRRAILSYPKDLGVVIVGTGGLSHQLTGTAFGTIKEEWDRQFLKLIAEDPERISDYTYEDLMKLGGTEAVEVVQWLPMRAALPEGARPHIEAYYPHRIMGYGLQAYDATSPDGPDGT